VARAAALLGAGRGDACAARWPFGRRERGAGRAAASVLSVLAIFLLWAAFTGSALVPAFLRAPGPFLGEAAFTTPPRRRTGRATTRGSRWCPSERREPSCPRSGPARAGRADDVAAVAAARAALVQAQDNDAVTAGTARGSWPWTARRGARGRGRRDWAGAGSN
jgi:hypothetical protein